MLKNVNFSYKLEHLSDCRLLITMESQLITFLYPRNSPRCSKNNNKKPALLIGLKTFNIQTYL